MRVEAVNVIHAEVERMTGADQQPAEHLQARDRRARAERASASTCATCCTTAFEAQRQNALGRGIEFRFEVPPNLGLVAIDKDLFRIALNNLLSNAIKYNVEGGHVALAAEEDGDHGLLIQVRDSGIGIAAEHLERIFDKYYRVARQRHAPRAAVMDSDCTWPSRSSNCTTAACTCQRARPARAPQFSIQMTRQTAPYLEPRSA